MNAFGGVSFSPGLAIIRSYDIPHYRLACCVGNRDIRYGNLGLNLIANQFGKKW